MSKACLAVVQTVTRSAAALRNSCCVAHSFFPSSPSAGGEQPSVPSSSRAAAARHRGVLQRGRRGGELSPRVPRVRSSGHNGRRGCGDAGGGEARGRVAAARVAQRCEVAYAGSRGGGGGRGRGGWRWGGGGGACDGERAAGRRGPAGGAPMRSGKQKRYIIGLWSSSSSSFDSSSQQGLGACRKFPASARKTRRGSRSKRGLLRRIRVVFAAGSAGNHDNCGTHTLGQQSTRYTALTAAAV